MKSGNNCQKRTSRDIDIFLTSDILDSMNPSAKEIMLANGKGYFAGGYS